MLGIMSDIATGFPKNLAYNLKKLDAGFSKTKVKIIPDNQSASANNITRFRITGNGIYDFRTLCLFATGKCTQDTTNVYLRFPRYSSSLIENISVTANNTTLMSINCYNYLYNMLMDIEGGDISQIAKRNAAGELMDPSVRYTISEADATNQAITAVNAVDSTVTTNDTDIPICINNWLGLFSSISTPCVDLSDFSDIYINIQWAPPQVLWQCSNTNAQANVAQAVTNPNFTLSDIFISIDRCSFQDPLYYNLKTEKLLSPEGLSVAYYDYYFVQGTLGAKNSGVSLNFNVNSKSLDQILVSFRHENYNTRTYPLLLHGASTSTAANQAMNFSKALSDPAAYENAAAGVVTGYITDWNFGDAFNQVLYFLRSGASITGSQFSINSVSIDPYKLKPLEIYNKVLQYTGFQNLDLGTSGVHAGCMSIHHFKKYYFVDICDLTNISGDNQFWISGLDGSGSGINVQYNADFNSGNTQKVTPVVWCRSTKHLRINAGRQLILDPPV